MLEQSDIPVGYVYGIANQMFPKIEKALTNKTVNDKISVILKPKQHFGPYDPSITFTDDIENVPKAYRMVGSEAEFNNQSGESIKMNVVKVEDGKVYLDGNHPFTGKQ